MVNSFASGPCQLPREVQFAMEAAGVSFHDGVPVGSYPHREGNKIVEAYARECEELVAKHFRLPAHYRTVILQGGATTHFWHALQNLCTPDSDSLARVAYIESGHWSRKAHKAACRMSPGNPPKLLPADTDLADLERLAQYRDAIYWCSNETADGTRIVDFPTLPCKYIADMSSNLFTQWIDIEQFGIILAGCQKTVGIAGATLVIFDETFVKEGHRFLPDTMNYRLQAEKHSLLNTPSVTALVAACYMLRWIDKNGGVAGFEQRCTENAQMLYDFLDNSRCFKAMVPQGAHRSRTNILFQLPDDEMDAEFVNYCNTIGIIHLDGHAETNKRLGRMHRRASCYAKDKHQIRHLVDAMKYQERQWCRS